MGGDIRQGYCGQGIPAVRSGAAKHVEAALPRLGDLVFKHAG